MFDFGILSLDLANLPDSNSCLASVDWHGAEIVNQAEAVAQSQSLA
eukprot:CAMPEP_0181319152 /NCGR_PEP_ID=MMETSP1101-20121128/17410_1 /TAXON_ID=46948 /ORGANISM="Rhodomonas abbreviata, Strain Caron Lab Isolate" /LENGTH=45 /DNA_ID= /DNA_START= /DNA_END= /DNA_ORIENTATION=